MRYQQKESKQENTRQIRPQIVWRSLTNKQQQQCRHIVEGICQQLAGRVHTKEEGDDANGQ